MCILGRIRGSVHLSGKDVQMTVHDRLSQENDIETLSKWLKLAAQSASMKEFEKKMNDME